MVTVRTETKTEAGNLRTIPLNSEVLEALKNHAQWYLSEFGETRPDWFLFPFGHPRPSDPTRHITSFKTVWTYIRKDAGIKGRWHDARHTLVTDLAESPSTSDQTIRELAGHVSPQMLKHYSHIRTDAKRKAVQGLESKPDLGSQAPVKDSPKVEAPN